MNKPKVLTALAITTIIGLTIIMSLLLYGLVSKHIQATASQLMTSGYTFDPLSYQTVVFVDPLAQAIAQTKQAENTDTLAQTPTPSNSAIIAASPKKYLKPGSEVYPLTAAELAEQENLKARYEACDMGIFKTTNYRTPSPFYTPSDKVTGVTFRMGTPFWKKCGLDILWDKVVSEHKYDPNSQSYIYSILKEMATRV